tara:strand:+ start:32 stop:436 length:405 start_codon:yes stop_codon:yes gene_type:complete
MGYKMKNSLGNLLNKTDMSKLRSKQSRASKGVSEHQHFSKQGTQGDEPKVEYNMEKSPGAPMKQDKKMKVTPGEKVKPKYTLKVGTKPDGTKDYFKVDESGNSTKISEATYSSMKHPGGEGKMKVTPGKKTKGQ